MTCSGKNQEKNEVVREESRKKLNGQGKIKKKMKWSGKNEVLREIRGK